MNTLFAVSALLLVGLVIIGCVVVAYLCARQASESAHDARESNALASAEVRKARDLQTQLVALEGAVASLRKSHQQLQGKFYAMKGPRVFDGESGEQLEGDDELSAFLAMQGAKPVQPR